MNRYGSIWPWVLMFASTAVAQDAAPPGAPERVEPALAPPAASETPPAASEPPPAATEPPPANAEPTEAERKALEAEFAQALAGEQEEKPATETTSSRPSGLALIDIGFDLLAAAGGSTAPEDELRSLEGGGHDPKNRGFTIQNVELTFAGVVDPYLRGDASIVLQIDEEGESVVELEEAYLTSLDLPLNLQLKAGQFFGAFGRLNATHPHAWDFVDQPVVNTRFLGGDGFRNPGAQLSWLTPLPFFAELLASAQNAQGETAPSFRGVPGEVVAGRVLEEHPVRNLGDLAYLLRLRTSFDFGEEVTLVGGTSALFGPNATDAEAHTEIYGVDLYLKWKPLSTDHGWPFVAWQSEAMYRRYEAAAVREDSDVADERRTLGDYGLYSQLVWGFARPWQIGVRYDFARGQDVSFTVDGETYSSASDPLRDKRQRASAMLTFYPSEFSKVRLQYSLDHAQFLDDDPAHSVYLQGEISFGAHGAHKF